MAGAESENSCVKVLAASLTQPILTERGQIRDGDYQKSLAGVVKQIVNCLGSDSDRLAPVFNRAYRLAQAQLANHGLKSGEIVELLGPFPDEESLD